MSDSVLSSQPLACVLFEGKNFTGNSQCLNPGNYEIGQLSVKKIGSIMLADGSRVIFENDAENPDPHQGYVIISESSPDVGQLAALVPTRCCVDRFFMLSAHLTQHMSRFTSPHEVSKVDGVRIHLAEDSYNCIYANGVNCVQVNIGFEIYKSNPEYLGDDLIIDNPSPDIVNSIKVSLYDYENDCEIDSGWVAHDSSDGLFEHPFKEHVALQKEENLGVESVKSTVVRKTIYLTHWFMPAKMVDSLKLGCKFEFNNKTQVFSRSSHNFPLPGDTIPFVKAFRTHPSLLSTAHAQESQTESSRSYLPPSQLYIADYRCSVLYDSGRRAHPRFDDTYNQLKIYKWTPRQDTYMSAVVGTPGLPSYYRIGYEGGKMETWWMGAGACIYYPGSYSIGIYSLCGGPYGHAENLFYNFSLSNGEFVIAVFLGEGYSWVNGTSYSQWSTPISFIMQDEYGTKYKFNVPAGNNSVEAPGISESSLDY